MSQQPIKLAILLAGETNRSMRPKHPNYEEMFTAFFAPAADRLLLDFVAVRQGVFPPSVDAYDAYLVTGSLYGVYDDPPWIAQLMDFIGDIYRHNIPLIGVCFGHQIVAHALGGKAVKWHKGWVAGTRRLPVLAHPLTGQASTGESMSLLYTHQDQVVALPPDAYCWLGDDLCQYAGFAIAGKVLTLQGHPEFAADYIAALIEKKRPDIGEAAADEALASLAADTDHLQARQLMVEFLVRNCGVQKSAA